MKPLLNLVMIVKNESASIREVLLAARAHIHKAVILDTGSSDGTQNLVRETLGDQVTVYEEAFAGYATSRNRILELNSEQENSAVFCLMLSGDEYLRNGEQLCQFLEKHRDSDVDLFKMKLVLDETANLQCRVFRTGSAWQYQDGGAGIDEFPVHPEMDAKVEVAPGLIEHIVADPEARLDTIWQKHIPMLRQKLDEDPENARTVQALAQRLEMLIVMPEWYSQGERCSAVYEVMSLYQRRLWLPIHSDEERNYFTFRYLDVSRWGPVFSPNELFQRVEGLYARYKRPETAQLRALAAMGVMMARKTKTGDDVASTYKIAAEAAEVAEQTIIGDAPVPTTCAWKTHHIAAKMALVMLTMVVRQTRPQEAGDWVARMKFHAERVLATGGPKEIVEEFAEAAA